MNKVTIKNKYPLSQINELFVQLKGEIVFSKIYFRLRYHQVHIKEKDIYKTMFYTRHGDYEFVVVPFGIINTQTTFMCLMKNVLCPYVDKFLIVFIDDILICSNNKEEKVENLIEVLRLLREN